MSVKHLYEYKFPFVGGKIKNGDWTNQYSSVVFPKCICSRTPFGYEK